MSRSYKKHAVIKATTPGTKREANRRVRRLKEVQDGNWYRKCYQPYDICDIAFMWYPDMDPDMEHWGFWSYKRFIRK